MMKIRKYGKPPYVMALIHGGPGAIGELAPVARELSAIGVLEPLQTRDSISGLVDELKTSLMENAKLPVVLIGWSWGAWLSYIFAARYPALVKKLILVSSGPFDEEYVATIMKTRLGRMSQAEKKALKSLESSFNNPKSGKDELLARFGRLFWRTDAFAPLDLHPKIKVSYDIYSSVWKEASMLRRNGQLLRLGKKIKCPVVAIHGDYDPHPADGVKEPLSKVTKDFRFILLRRCGHTPWNERYAKKRFYSIIRKETSF